MLDGRRTSLNCALNVWAMHTFGTSLMESANNVVDELIRLPPAYPCEDIKGFDLHLGPLQLVIKSMQVEASHRHVGDGDFSSHRRPLILRPSTVQKIREACLSIIPLWGTFRNFCKLSMILSRRNHPLAMARPTDHHGVKISVPSHTTPRHR